MRYRIGLAGACALAFALAGCGSTVIDAGKVEKLIRDKAAGPPFNLKIKSVTCPSNRPAKKGDKFTCTLTLDNGEAEQFNITQLDDKGNVHIELGQEIATYVEATINSGLASQGLKVTSVCPQHVPVVVGSTFTCAVTAANGQHGTAKIRILDTTGAFKIISLHGS